MEYLKKYYIKYKKQILPLIFLSLSFFLIFRVILPQISAISESNQLISSKTSQIDTLQKTLSVVSSQNDSLTEEQLGTATKALPGIKDIVIIFEALTSAAGASRTELREFSLKVGGVYGRAAKVTGFVKGVPSISVTTRISGDPLGLIRFSKEAQERLPLAEVKTVDTNKDTGTFEIDFFYKPYDITAIAKSDKVSPLTQADLNLLSQLKEWDK
ncbi:MAG: hypothetical protein A3C27_00525 [Candidatus Levybacteria bacterium RIFCSPHIGHO2_02_FULL_39_36]|nr:MAG: hypothetical protein UT20_C0001G0030 [Candidatus Levybacteria bacterium GW2011_GWA1_39_11]KKR25321.1 MAG: hypothetical protein UT56_C0001G0052 [Candidatus Levybacteria bacterium GW2011_GWB1_39_7]KKR27594.1 MAG: hypothetical protein UT57_C0001G0018 [Microgenomates group bacterium GW2011_GWC1_39_7]KKR50432.1 MAG: hypothetical protein UT85_C0002G0040 [Candidatus Levybacteria bacterium GW2011_GWA2_40_16]OGH14480.1 MAG: hypothetical protein A2689_00435 [Candidatus Levybacteria bacterium RIFC